MITKEELDFMGQEVSEVFLGFTNLLLNASIYGLIKRNHYLIRSKYLDSLVSSFFLYRIDDAGALKFIAQDGAEDDVRTLFTRIMSFSSEQLNGLLWNMNYGTLQQGEFIPANGSRFTNYEILVTADGQAVFSGIPVNENYYLLVSGYLNGVLISPGSNVSYAGGVLTYTGPVATKKDDIIRLLFQFKIQ